MYVLISFFAQIVDAHGFRGRCELIWSFECRPIAAPCVRSPESDYIADSTVLGLSSEALEKSGPNDALPGEQAIRQRRGVVIVDYRERVTRYEVYCRGELQLDCGTKANYCMDWQPLGPTDEIVGVPSSIQ